MSHADHLSDRELGGYLYGELSDVERARTEKHLDRCPVCREELDRLRWASDWLSRELERAGSAGSVDDLEGHPEAPSTPEDSGPPSRIGSCIERVTRSPARVVALALFVLVVTATGAAAVPGSPLRPVADELLRTVAELFDGEPRPDRMLGLQAPPDSGRLEIHIVRPVEGTALTLRLVDDSTGGAWTSDGRVQSRSGRIEVIEPGPGPVEVHVPRTARTVQVLSSDRVVATWNGSDLQLSALAPDSARNEYKIRLMPDR